MLALSVIAEPLALLPLGLAAVVLTACSLYGPDTAGLRRFAVINGLAMLLLGWASFEQSELYIQRGPDQIDVSLNGVHLGASLAGVNAPVGQIGVSLSAVDERPTAAPWVFDPLPWVERFGTWLAGGMRGGVGTLQVRDASGADLVPPLSGVWQPGRSMASPLFGAMPDGWELQRAPDGEVMVLSPAVSAERLEVRAVLLRPSGAVTVTLDGGEEGSSLDVVVAPDRRQYEIVARSPEGIAETLVGGPFVYRRGAVEWLQALLREIGRTWLVGIALVAGARLLSLPFSLTIPAPNLLTARVLTGLAGIALGVVTTIFGSLVAFVLLEGIPHTVESIAYLFEAQILVRGGLWAPAPLLPEFFEQAYIAVSDGRWFGVLPPGQSLLLAVGLLVGAPWLVSPLAIGAAVALTVALGRAAYGTLAGILAGLLLLFSPFVLMLSGDMLAHPAALLFTVSATLGVALAIRRPLGPLGVLGWLLCGLGVGALVLTRPLAALGIGVPLTMVLVSTARRLTRRGLFLRAILWLAAALPTVLYAGIANATLSGSPFVPVLSLWSDLDRIGFGPTIGTRGGHDLASALGNAWANTAVMLRHLYGWPSYLTLALACVPFILGTRSRWDYLMLLAPLGLGTAQLLYWSDGIVYGPRFAFEGVAALSLLTARGATLLARGDGCVPDEPMAVTGTGAPVPAQTATTLEGTGISAAPVAVTLVSLLFAINLVGYLPEVVVSYRGYNGVNADSKKIVDAAGLEQAVVFVTSEYPDWQSYGQLFPANGPLLDGNVIFARDLGENENWRLMTRYAERRYWLLRGLQLTEIRR